jgi:SHS2 domain-containing protein
MDRYVLLPHTADGKFRAFGASLEEAFGNAALALASLMWDWSQVRPALSQPVEVKGRDREQLLYKFLEEILFLFETRRFLLAAVEGLRIEESGNGFRLKAEFRGDDRWELYELYGEVKAITYSQMKIEGCGGAWVIQVVVDM